MNKNFKFFIIVLLALSIMPLSVLAKSNDWIEFDEKYDVSLNKEWTITFSDEVTHDSIDGIVIENNNEFIPVRIRLLGGNKATVKPVEPYEPNSKYYIKIFLNNGNKYKMNFNTELDNKNPENKEYNIGDKIIMDDVEITITSIEYLTRAESFHPGKGEIFATVNFDVFTTLEPKDSFYWNSIDFIKNISVEDKLLSAGFSTGEKGNIYANQRTQTSTYKTIPIDKKLTYVVVKHPVSQEGIKVNIGK